MKNARACSVTLVDIFAGICNRTFLYRLTQGNAWLRFCVTVGILYVNVLLHYVGKVGRAINLS